MVLYVIETEAIENVEVFFKLFISTILAVPHMVSRILNSDFFRIFSIKYDKQQISKKDTQNFGIRDWEFVKPMR